LKVGGAQYAQAFTVEALSTIPDPSESDGLPPTVVGVDAADTLSPVEKSLMRVFHFDNQTKKWSFYDPDLPEFSTLTQLVEGEVYWLGVEGNQTATLHGKIRTFFSGWNLIVW
jgi:hypothetical protein